MLDIGHWTRSAFATTWLISLTACGSNEAAQDSGPITIEQAEARIGSDAVMLMDRESFSDTYAKLGEQQFQNANDLTRWAAIAAVAQGPVCDRVEIIGVSGRSTRERIAWFADCENGERIIVEQPEAESARLQFDSAAASSGEPK